MANEGPNWEGLLKWSLSHADGTHSHPPRHLSEEERVWFMEAIQERTVNLVTRMKDIIVVMKIPEQVLESQGLTTADIEEMLDELKEHVESIDMANDFHSIGGLPPLLGYLKHSNANIRAKAADVVTTLVQNNPRSQELVMKANGMEPLLSNFTSDPDVSVRTSSIVAIASLIRQNNPGISAFRSANAYAALRESLSSENVRFQRKTLNLIHYLLQENSEDCNILKELGFPPIMIHLVSSKDLEVREGALRGLLELSRYSSLSEDNGKKLKKILQERIDNIILMPSDDLETAREEIQLVDSIWNVCYKQPSSLQEKGLLVLPGEDDLPPDVASEHLEPTLRRVWAANQRETAEKKEQNADGDV
ncbi:hsp70-binding protein 1-like [Impatiens glandulifera]|uniref:hsp70-binding protein 1-like n=1 Tax=Impatiens glandulifera TaxID=253017 RepID=UPI001FB0A021|nr:hsp70-binding protein 1-like [Impatiens glandulifera]